MVKSSFRLSISGRCCLGGSSIHQPIFCCSSYSPQTLALVKSTTMWPHHSHNIFGLPLFLWHCTFPSSINFFNGWFRLHVRNNLFFLFNKVPDLTTAMDWFVVCFVHDTQNISRYNFIFKCIYAFLHVFVQGPRFTSMWQLKICTFIMRCLILLFVAFHSLSMPLPTSVWFFFYLRQLLSMTQYILNCSPLLFLHKLI